MDLGSCEGCEWTWGVGKAVNGPGEVRGCEWTWGVGGAVNGPGEVAVSSCIRCDKSVQCVCSY